MDVKRFTKSPFSIFSSKKARTKLMHQSLFSALIVYALVQLPPSFFTYLIPPFIVSILYAVPVLGPERRPRDIPFLKIFLIAFVWAWISTLPAGTPFEHDRTKWFMLAERFCFIYAITIPFDLRDMVFDQSHNTRTIPHQIGHKKSILTALSALVVGCIIALLAQTPDRWSLVATSLVSAFIIVKWNPHRPYYYYLFYLDGCILLYSLLIVAFKLLKI